MTRYSVAIAGCGPRGAYHAEGFAANADRFDVTACCDLDVGRAEEFARRFGIGKVYSDVDAMLAAEKPYVFCFATLPDVRLSLVELGIKHGVKVIAFEKPVATELAEAQQIFERCREAGIKLVVSHQQKYGPHFQAVKRIVESGEIGKVTKIHATARPWLSQLGTHFMDYMLYFNGRSPVKWVVAQAIGTGMLTDSHPSADYVIADMEFENGVRGIFECGAHAPHFVPGENPLRDIKFWTDSSITIHGTHGYAEVTTGNGYRAFTRNSQGEMIEGDGNFNPSYEQPLYIRDLADWLDGKIATHPCDGDIAYHGFQAVMAMYMSALDRKRVDLPLAEIPQGSLIARLGETLPHSDEYQGQ
ncbi:Gfo/Idh/MocA family oxidoreductase [Mesorhizobium sp. BR1-1-16]|uniref:Gfo/Idh/MocA family protein n=1 Tax=Mesorhizobium sp. BR1-1-16 TaxID=2876653 RepID=UPI001CCDA473|nr:Gfo/Idh/MocA family oxidoreductase [Mesorhizobium sp. BR1-1-16]MBZ9939324.1 Gfo/Idh/MocA family oxidoreductase [Mesorhizobium sp. BR1-1-16]